MGQEKSVTEMTNKPLGLEKPFLLLTIALGVPFMLLALFGAAYVTHAIVGAYIHPGKDVPGGVNTFFTVFAGTLLVALLGVWEKTRNYVAQVRGWIKRSEP